MKVGREKTADVQLHRMECEHTKVRSVLARVDTEMKEVQSIRVFLNKPYFELSALFKLIFF